MISTSDLAVQLVRLDGEIDILDAQLKEMRKQRALLSTALTERYGTENVQSLVVNVDGKRKTVYLRRQYWAKKKDESIKGEEIYDALIQAGLPELAQRTYSPQTLSAFFRERRDENPDYDIPGPLSQLVEFKETAQVVVTGK